MRLRKEMERLIDNGVTNFVAGGAMGFDQMAAECVLAKRQEGDPVWLVLALPYRGYDQRWPDNQRIKNQFFIDNADEVLYLSEQYHKECMKKRNYYMVDHSAYCICAMIREISGTGQTVRYAKRQNLNVVNIAGAESTFG